MFDTKPIAVSYVNGYAETYRISFNNAPLFADDERTTATFTYDQSGRLVQLRIGNHDNYEFQDFAQMPDGTYYHRTIIRQQLGVYQAGGKTWVVPFNQLTYTVLAADFDPIPDTMYDEYPLYDEDPEDEDDDWDDDF